MSDGSENKEHPIQEGQRGEKGAKVDSPPSSNFVGVRPSQAPEPPPPPPPPSSDGE